MRDIQASSFQKCFLHNANIMALTTDNGANIIAAVEMLFHNGNSKHLSCVAYTDNVSVMSTDN